MKRHLLKRLIIVSVLLVALLGLVAPSAASAASPTISIYPTSAQIPRIVGIAGYNWSPYSTVDIYLDPDGIPDPHRLIGQAQTYFTGYFEVKITFDGMSVGPHEIVAVQGTDQASATFTVIMTTPLDDRIKDEIIDLMTIVENIQYTVNLIWDKLGNVQSTVNQIWDKLGNVQSTVNQIWDKLGNVQSTVNQIWTKLGNVQTTVNSIWNKLGNVQTTVNDIHGEVFDSNHGLEEIKDEVSNIETTVNNIESDLGLKITYREFNGSATSQQGTDPTDLHDAHKVNLRSVSGEPMCIVHVAVHSNPWFFNQLYNKCWVRAWIDTGSGEFLARSVDLAKESCFSFPSPGKYRIEVIRLQDGEGAQTMKWYIIEEIREGDLVAP